MTSYRGERTIDGPLVLRDGVALDLCLAQGDYSVFGADWGCRGEQSRQLAYALLHDHFGDSKLAHDLVPAFENMVIAELDNEWDFDSAYIAAAVEAIQRAGAHG